MQHGNTVKWSPHRRTMDGTFSQFFIYQIFLRIFDHGFFIRFPSSWVSWATWNTTPSTQSPTQGTRDISTTSNQRQNLISLAWLLHFHANYFPSYDFIIVGAGSAGSVLANRLSEIPNWKVLLLEAGSDENTVSDIPAVAAYLQGSSLDWQFKTEPQPTACLGLVGN